MPEWKDVLAALASLVASFAGAWAAFRFEGWRRKTEEEKKSVGASNRAIYGVYGFWNVLEQYRKEALEPFRARPDDAWLNLAAHPTPPSATDRFQTADLQFLLENGQPGVFAALMLEQQRFDLAMGLIAERSRLVLESVFPKIAAAGFAVGKSQNLADVEKALGIDLCHQLRQMTGAIYQNVDEDLASLRKAYDELRGALKAIYPKHKFFQIVFETDKHDASVPTSA
jgi:hypothetical protein